MKKWRCAFMLWGLLSSGYLLTYPSGSDSLLVPGEGVGLLDFLTPLEKEVVVELNLARTKPWMYVAFIEEFKTHYAGKYIYVAGQTQIVTTEGVVAVDDAIQFLKTCQPLPLLHVSKGLSLAARDHVKSQGPSGQTGHTGNDGSTIVDRLNRFGTWGGAYGENIEYGNVTAREIVMQLIIDDGVLNRGHRLNIFSPNFTLVGVHCGPHLSYGQMCVQNFAGSYRENPSGSGKRKMK